jgi:GTP-binding protein HflX
LTQFAEDGLFERPRGGERAVLVHVQLEAFAGEQDFSEFRELAMSAGAECMALITGRRQAPDPRLFVGSGKAEEIREAVRQNAADLAIFDHDLDPRTGAQSRSFPAMSGCGSDSFDPGYLRAASA